MQTSFNTKSSEKFKGIFTALVTPFKTDGSLDLSSFELLLDQQLESKVHGVVPCGTTGESPTLSSEEKQSLIKSAVKKCRGQIPVLAGTGINSTKKTIEDSKIAEDLGADGLLIVTPYYNKPSQAGLEAHYLAVADKVRIPIILYNVPGRTGVSLAANTVASLASHPQIAGIKEATGNLQLLTEMQIAVANKISNKPFSFLSGDDPTFWPFLTCGGHGVISVASNIIPQTMRLIFELYNERNLLKGAEVNSILNSFLNTLFIESNPVPIKTAMSWAGTLSPNVRLPLVSLREENVKKLQTIWSGLPKELKK